MSTHKNYGRAALFSLISFTGWTFSDTLLKLVRIDGVPKGEILFVSGLSGMVIIFLIAAARRKVRNLQPRKWSGLFIIGLCQWLSFLFWLAALPHLALTCMYAVAFMTPVTVAALAALLLKEHLGWRRGTAITAGFMGVIIAINPIGLMENSGKWLPYLAVFGNMACTATQMLVLRVVSQHETSECTAFYPRLVILTAGAIMCATEGLVAMAPLTFLAICASGALGGMGWALMSQAYKNAPAAAVAPFHYSQMITGAILGYLIWGNVPNAWLVCGASIIIGSGIYLVRHERRASRTMTRQN